MVKVYIKVKRPTNVLSPQGRWKDFLDHNSSNDKKLIY